MTRVFISHSSDTRVEAKLLAEALRARSIEVFLDVDSIELGSDWREEIDKALRQTECIAVVVGPEPERDSMVRNEWSSVLQEVWAGSDKLLVPVLVRGAVLPPFLSKWQYLRPEGDWDGVAAEIDRAIQGAPTALGGAPAEADLYRKRALERIRRLKAEIADSPALQADSAR